MGFLDHVKLWSDVLDPRLDEKAAPSLGGVHLGKEESIYTNPTEFFRRTLITRYMAEALEGIIDAITGGGGNRLFMLLSLFGGGKTHTLLTIYHAFRSPIALLEAKAEDEETRKRIQRLVERLQSIRGISIVVLDGYFSELMPTPVNPLNVGAYQVRTIWGSLAHQLGRYGEVKRNDERLLAPPADVVLRVLGDQPVLILVDELADHVVRLKSAGDPQLRGYADQVVSFMETLAKAVDLTRNTILIVSMPAEEKGPRLEVEERYKPVMNVVMGLYKSVSRVASKKIVPVAPSDVPSILRVRLFEQIDSKAAKATASTMSRLYSEEEHKEVFGEDAIRIAHEIEKTYPFHPTYIDTLITIVDKHEGLEKTRDAIRISRKVVRELSEQKSSAELIMPYHIDVENREIRGTLLSRDIYRQYATVVDEDIVERTRQYEKPELAKVIAKTIFVRSFVYAGSIKHHQLYPDKNEILVSSYELSLARTLSVEPKDFIDALEWISSNLVYALSEGGRYWFTQFATPIRRVEMTAKTVEDYEAMKVVEEYAWKLLSKPCEDVVGGSRRRGSRSRRPSKTPFSINSSMVLKEITPIDHDSKEYVLLAILSPLREEDIQRIMYETASGGTRRYANTVYLIFPKNGESVAQMIGLAKHLVACSIVEEELENIYEDSETREVMKKKLEKYCKGMEGIEGKLVVNILAGLNRVAYPSFDANTHRNTFGLTDASMTDTIIETATRALRSIRPAKLYEELDFDLLEYLLSQAGIELAEGDQTKRVADIIDYFYSNPKLPMVRDEVVKNAILDGVKSLRIGVRKGSKIYFKKIYECTKPGQCTPPSVEEGEQPHSIELDDVVLPWRIALQEQLENLKETKEERVTGGIKKIWHAFYINGELIPVAEALESFDLDTLRLSPLMRVVEVIQEGVDVKLDKYEVSVAPNEKVTISIVLDRVGTYSGKVLLETSSGNLSHDEVTIDDRNPTATIEWEIKAPEKPGSYTYDLKAKRASGEVLRETKLTLVVRPKGREANKGVPPKGTKISVIEVEVNDLNFKPLKIIDIRFGLSGEVEEASLELQALAGDRNPEISVKLSNVTLDDVKSIFPTIVQRYGIAVKNMKYKLRIRPRTGDYIESPEFSEEEIKDLEGYMTYYVYEEG